jgi:hypothetical protein
MKREMKTAELVNAFMIEVKPPVADCKDLDFDPLQALHCFKLNNGLSQAFTFRKEGFRLSEESTETNIRDAFMAFAQGQITEMQVTKFDGELHQLPGIAAEEGTVAVRSLFDIAAAN